jgi:hypothetical protein
MICIRAIRWAILASLLLPLTLAAQVQDTLPPEEEDYSMYDDLEFVDVAAKSYCNPKILDLSPRRFVSIGWDAQLAHTIESSPTGEYQPDDDFTAAESADISYAGGLWIDANVPVISRNSFIWQLGGQYRETRYSMQNRSTEEGSAGLHRELADNGLRNIGLNTTLFKPLNEKHFLYLQVGANLSGDYALSSPQSLDLLRYNAAFIWGKRPSDFKQWGVGVARTYRIGELNYVPVVMFNWTAVNRKWGTEILFPARAHVRRTFNPRSLLLGGYELDGSSYRVDALSTDGNSFELRRSELRFRLEYQRQLVGFIWWSAQVGYRYNWSFNADELEGGNEFFRGFFGDQSYVQRNDLGNPIYFNISIHLVSP